MHLHIAEQIFSMVAANGNGRLQQTLAADWPAFYLGSVAPDVNAISPLPREGTHFYDVPPAPEETAYGAMLEKHPQLTDFGRMSAGQAVFVAGYSAHLMLDLIWLREIVYPFFFKADHLGDRKQRQLTHFILLTYLDTIAFEALPETAVSTLATALPVFPYGVSTHRQAFAGTLNCGGRAFEDFWLGVIDVLVARGFNKMYFISGHGGNVSFLVTVVKYAGERHRRIFCATTWLHTSGKPGAEALAKHRRSARGGMGHAGELETAMMLHLRPDLVQMAKVVDETDFVSTASYYMDWVEGGALVANPPWEDDTATGSYGAGSVATAVNGKLWLETAVLEKVAHVQEIHEQQQRREARRMGNR